MNSEDGAEAPAPNDVATPVKPRSPRRYRWIRIGLLILHIVVLVAAMGITPEGYFVQLGYYTGTVILFGTLVLWVVLFAGNSRNAMLLFCALAVAQIGLVAVVGWHFRSEDAVLQQVMVELAQQAKQWQEEMSQFRMDAVADMISGKRLPRPGELEELRTRARGGKAKAQEFPSVYAAFTARMESRMSAKSASDFQRGVESTQAEATKQNQMLQDYFAEMDGLLGFLIDRQQHYRTTATGLVFEADADAQAFNSKIDAIADLEKQMASSRQRAEEVRQQINSTH